jgi:hypothetical protein
VRRFSRAPRANGDFLGGRLAIGFRLVVVSPKAWRVIASNLASYMTIARADVKLSLREGGS